MLDVLYRSINALQQKCKFRRHGCCPVHLHVEGNYVFEEVTTSCTASIVKALLLLVLLPLLLLQLLVLQLVVASTAAGACIRTTKAYVALLQHYYYCYYCSCC
jgi:hypothetical protein